MSQPKSAPGPNDSFVGSFAGSFGNMRVPQPAAADISNFAIVKEILVMGTPLGLAAVAQISIGTVLVAMVGQLVGVEQLGATSLAFGLINATAFTCAAGFSGALETVLSYSYGRDPNSKLYGVYAQRMALLLLIVSAVLGPVLAFADVLLDAIGQNPAVVYFTGKFCRVALFGVYPVMMLEIMRRYFACQHLNGPLSINLIISAVVFPFILYPSIKLFGYEGAPIAWVLLMIAMPASLLAYLIHSKRYKQTWGGWDTPAIRNWGPLLKLAFPSMAMMLSEWASLEINAITAGFAPAESLAAFSVMYQTSSILWSLTSGIFIEAAVLVGSALGQGNPQLARRCAYICVLLAAIQGLINFALTFFLRNYIPRIFSDDEKVRETFATLVHFFALYHVFDCIQSCMMGVLRGCGKQVAGSIVIALVYSIVGVPLGIILFFNTSLGVKALWLGPGIGVSCVGFPTYMYMLFRYLKWEEMKVDDGDSPSLNSSVDRHSILSHGLSPTNSVEQHNETEPDDVHDATTSPSGSRSATFPSSRLHTPGSALLEPLDNASFASHFHIPRRNILITPSVNSFAAAVQSSPKLPPTSARSGPLEDNPIAGATLSSPVPFALPPVGSHVHTPGEQHLVGTQNVGTCSTSSLHGPPSRASSRSASTQPSPEPQRNSSGAPSQSPSLSLAETVPEEPSTRDA